MKKSFISSVLLLLFFSGIAYAQDNSSAAYDKDSVLSAAREIIGMHQYCALITVDSSGLPQIRTMNPFPPENDMTVWMATKTTTRKVKEIEKNPNVCLYYGDHGKPVGYVAINGKAELVYDMKEVLKRKRAYWDQSFPGLKDIVLIKVTPVTINVLNYKHNLNGEAATWRTPFIKMDKSQE